MDVYHKDGEIVRVYVPPAEQGDVRRRLLRHGVRNFAVAVGSVLKASVIDPIGERQGSLEKRDAATNALADSFTLVQLLRIGKGIVLGEDAAQLHYLYLQSREAEAKKEAAKNAKSHDRHEAIVSGSIVHHDLNTVGMNYPETAVGKVLEVLEEVNCRVMVTYEGCIVAQRALEAAMQIAAKVDSSLIGEVGAEALYHADIAGKAMENALAEIGTYQQVIR